MRRTLSLLAFLALFASCITDNLDTVLPAADPVIAADSQTVPIEAALDEMYSLMDELYGPSTRASRPAIVSIETAKGSAFVGQTRSDGAPLPENLAYVVNFGEEEGFAILGADYGMPSVICIAEAGSMTLADILDAPSTRSATQPTAEQRWVPYSQMEGYVYDPADDPDPDGGEYLVEAPEGTFLKKTLKFTLPILLADPSYAEPTYTYRTEVGTWTNGTTRGPYLTTQWHQNAPFNRNCPSQHVAGCTPIAVAQIIAWGEKKPTSYFGVTSTWTQLKSHGTANYNALPLADRTRIDNDLATIIRAICTGVKARFNFCGSGETFASVIHAKQYMKKDLGYTGAKRRVGYNEDRIKAMINGGKPVLIAALANGFNGHSWVIDGSMEQSRTIRKIKNENNVVVSTSTESRLLFHCNFGWRNGNHNGYYVSGAFKTNNDAGLINTGTRSESDGHYRNLFKIVEY